MRIAIFTSQKKAGRTLSAHEPMLDAGNYLSINCCTYRPLIDLITIFLFPIPHRPDEIVPVSLRGFVFTSFISVHLKSFFLTHTVYDAVVRFVIVRLTFPAAF